MTVLLVEDEDSLRSVLREMLESFGYTVLDASQGRDALRIAQEHSGTIHLLLSDVVMPGMSGTELADRLTRLRPGLKVLFMSGYGEGAPPSHEIPRDAPCIEKPFTADILAGALRTLLDAPGS